MKYIRTKDGRIISANIAIYELTQKICDAGYLKTLDKGSYVTIGEEWTNFYGRWVDIIDEKGSHYSIKPNEVKEVTRELSQVDTIEELCDEFVCIGSAEYQKYVKHSLKEALQKKEWLERKGYTCNIYGAIWTDGGLIYKAKMKDVLPNGEIDWELL